MAAMNAATVAGLVATLTVVAWSIEGRGQPLRAGVHPEPLSQAPATTPGTVPSTPPAPRPGAPRLKVWPLTALSTERRRSTPKSGVTAGVGNTRTEQRSGPARRAGGAPLPRTTAAGTAGRPRSAVAGAPAAQEPRRARAAVPESALEFDASLETILYSPERRLAIVDGRIVQVGDEIRGARIVDITPGVVFLRDSSGEARTLSLAADR